MRALLLLAFLPTAALAQTGTLRSGDPTLDDGEFYHTYTLDLRGGDTVEADLTSRDFDTYLMLVAPSGETAYNDDYEGSQQRSYLTLRAAEGGRWRAVVTSYAADETGAYRLMLRVNGRAVQGVRMDQGAPTPPAGVAPAAAAAPAGACPSTGAARLGLDTPTVTPNQPLRIRHAYTTANYMDSVGFHQLLPGGRTRYAKGAYVWGVKDGTVELEAPGLPGSYELRYEHNYTGETLACVRVEVAQGRLDAPAAATGTVPTGIYETYFFGYEFALNKWLGGDIEILAGGRYRFQDAAGRYGLDAASGQVVWHDGPLRGVFTRFRPDSDGRPALVIPKRENAALGIELAVSDLWGYLRQAHWRR